jgi:hypothetical protein
MEKSWKLAPRELLLQKGKYYQPTQGNSAASFKKAIESFGNIEPAQT